MERIQSLLILPFCLITLASVTSGDHNPGSDCRSCHPEFKLGGTVYTDNTGTTTMAGVLLKLFNHDREVVLDNSNTDGNIMSPTVPDGNYRIQLGEISSRTWHNIPGLGSCNSCHKEGGNPSGIRTMLMPEAHTSIHSANDCTHCHHFPAPITYERLKTSGVLNGAKLPLSTDESFVEIRGARYSFEPSDYSIETVRPDVFAPGFFSIFDVILAVAAANGIKIEYQYDVASKTHWIHTIDGVSGDYWHHWVFDTGGGNYMSDLNRRRDNRWDEILWRPGARIQVVEGENVAELKQAYHQEIAREKANGHIIDTVSISINPSDYQGNPEGSGRITISRQFDNVKVTAHDLRASTAKNIYSKPFQSGVVTVADIVLSLKDQGKLDLVFPVFFDRIHNCFIDSYYVQALGFPDVGVAHASGSQGFVCRTHLGVMNGRNVNDAASSFHIPLDLQVIHSPNYSLWRWIELGNPYYGDLEEEPEKSKQTKHRRAPTLVMEDWNAIDRGFNLHPVFPNPFHSAINISFNVFEPAFVDISVFNSKGKKLETLLEKRVKNIGVQRLEWPTENQPNGAYFVVMKYDKHQQTRSVLYEKTQNRKSYPEDEQKQINLESE